MRSTPACGNSPPGPGQELQAWPRWSGCWGMPMHGRRIYSTSIPGQGRRTAATGGYPLAALECHADRWRYRADLAVHGWSVTTSGYPSARLHPDDDPNTPGCRCWRSSAFSGRCWARELAWMRSPRSQLPHGGDRDLRAWGALLLHLRQCFFSSYLGGSGTADAAPSPAAGCTTTAASRGTSSPPADLSAIDMLPELVRAG